MKSIRLFWGSWAVVALLGGCLIHGGGSDTETVGPAIRGSVTNSSGEPLAKVRVKLIPADFDPSFSSSTFITTHTDDSGKFVFPDVDDSTFYNLIAGDPQGAGWAVSENIHAGMESRVLALSPAKVFVVSLRSSIYNPVLDSGVAYFPGTDIFVRCDENGPSLLDSVPLGVNRIVVRSLRGWQHDSTVTIVGDTVRVQAFPDKLVLQ